MQSPVAILSARRTPIGGLMGSLSSVPVTALGSAVIRSAVDDSGLSNDVIDELLMGCVLTAGVGQAPARQAALAANLSDNTSCSTIQKVCGSGMKAVMLACNSLRSCQVQSAVAGGMESMSRAPHLLPDARRGYRFGAATMTDHMQFDGLQDAYQSVPMGNFAEHCAQRYAFTREQQDRYALESLRRANVAISEGLFVGETTPVMVSSRSGEICVDQDEQPRRAKAEKIPHLKPAFRKDGTVTAANASSISDGAAALTLMMADRAEQQGLRSIALIHAYDDAAHEPEWFTTAPVSAISKTLKKVGWSFQDVDLWEINEAFAVVAMAAMQELQIDHQRLNIHGGACALGHPIGASGARILVTLLHALKTRKLKRGIASVCIGGGEATAIAVELV